MSKSKMTILNLFLQQIIYASNKKNPRINIKIQKHNRPTGKKKPCTYSIKIESEVQSSLPVYVEKGRKNKRKKVYIKASKLAKKLSDKGFKKITINNKDWRPFYDKEVLKTT